MIEYKNSVFFHQILIIFLHDILFSKNHDKNIFPNNYTHNAMRNGNYSAIHQLPWEPGFFENCIKHENFHCPKCTFKSSDL